jgi:hypothetical protein
VKARRGGGNKPVDDALLEEAGSSAILRESWKLLWLAEVVSTVSFMSLGDDDPRTEVWRRVLFRVDFINDSKILIEVWMPSSK